MAAGKWGADGVSLAGVATGVITGDRTGGGGAALGSKGPGYQSVPKGFPGWGAPELSVAPYAGKVRSSAQTTPDKRTRYGKQRFMTA